jgi:hypothetical protein
MNAIAAPATTDPLWTRVRAMFARAVAVIGQPAAIAALTLLSERLRREIVSWLAPLEHIVRKLLLAEAAALKREHAMAWRQRPPVRTASLQARNGAGFKERCEPEGSRSNPHASRHLDPAHPETWSATFSLAPPRDPLAVPNARAPRIRALWGETPSEASPTSNATPRTRDGGEENTALRLARRFEALRRVLENPQPHAQRLARLLARAVRRFPEIARRYWSAPARTGDYDKEDPRLSVDAMGAAFDAPYAFEDSS